MVASFPEVKYGRMFYRNLDNFKSLALKQKLGKILRKSKGASNLQPDLGRWIDNIENEKRFIKIGNPVLVLTSDALLGEVVKEQKME